MIRPLSARDQLWHTKQRPAGWKKKSPRTDVYRQSEPRGAELRWGGAEIEFVKLGREARIWQKFDLTSNERIGLLNVLVTVFVCQKAITTPLSKQNL